jgi:hypothetical protein
MKRALWMVLLAVVLVLVILGGAFVVWIGSPMGPDLEEVAHLKEPRLTTMAPQKVIVVTAQGAPNAVAGKAFGLLMKTYFRLEGVPKYGPALKAPRGRWPVESGQPADEWIGHYAIPVPDTVTELTGSTETDGLRVELESWDYGEVAEILHQGRYDEEEPTVERLKAFIDESGYEITGLHEEEYLKGPGILFAGNPESFLTIIRYPVRKKPPSGDLPGESEPGEGE